MSTKRLRIYPYKAGSRSAKDLAQSLGVLRLKHRNSRFRERPTDVIINWGSGSCPHNCLNSPEAVNRASDKLAAFNAMENDDSINVPPFTTDQQVAAAWISDDNKKVVCRTLTRANSGRGIVLAETVDELVRAPLYTQYVPKTQEYRVHVFNGEILDVQRKARSMEVPDEDVNWQIRNHDNGFIFAREDVSLPDVATSMAVNAVAAVGLDFGAVDMIYNQHRDTYYVLEINTAPGLTGTTLEKYTNAILRLA